ncbi:glycerophosphodiester phosphodiesterase family protein [Proteiniphilum sp. X52]|uniref:glycerophosphodiester phosphodiesterase family protein n=1 Tax=Proteiniphilum sp. X52 TaxID=2382159 RepID=UPI000F0A8827|nr:glycerophosphodiester phosphodiesterase family protein [Proteiniphilum sp. X52]RNC64180.1 hypothetical protein D7D25_12440 [Proteiniphilum sp. X52]
MRKFLLFVFCCFCCDMGFAGQSDIVKAIKDRENKDYVWIAGHRCDWIYSVENSTDALKNAIRIGVDIAETDVRLTKDGKIIMMHDATIDRTTEGKGVIIDMTLDEIRQYHMRSINYGGKTDLLVPTLEEFIDIAKGKILLYLDKAGYEIPGKPEGYMVQQVLKVLEKKNALEESIFVLEWPYEKAKRIFGDKLEKVIFCPAISDRIPNINEYVDDWIAKYNPVLYQFRMKTLDTDVYKQLPKVLGVGAKPFVAATWPEHTANHDDQISIFDKPSKGWGWLLEQGFRVLETNYPHDLLRYLKYENWR